MEEKKTPKMAERAEEGKSPKLTKRTAEEGKSHKLTKRTAEEGKSHKLTKRHLYIIAIVVATLVMVLDIGFCVGNNVFGSSAGGRGPGAGMSFASGEFSRSFESGEMPGRPDESGEDSADAIDGSAAGGEAADGAAAEASTNAGDAETSNASNASDASASDGADAASSQSASDSASGQSASGSSETQGSGEAAGRPGGNGDSMRSGGSGPSGRGGRSGGSSLPVKVGVIALLVVCLIVDAFSIFGLVRLRRRGDEDDSDQDAAPIDPVELRLQKRRRQKIIAAAVAALVVITVVVLQLLGNSATQNSGASVEEKVVNQAVESGSITKTLSTYGILASADEENVSVPGDIKVTKYHVAAGDAVKAGDIIATIDRDTVLAAIDDIQELIDELDAEVVELKESSASTTLDAPADGTVVKVYAESGEAVSDVMYDHGALMLVSLDGLLAVTIDNNGSLTVGDTVTVVGESATVDGTVADIEQENVTITVALGSLSFDDKVTVFNSAGDTLGKGKLVGHNQQKITGYSGTVSYVNVSEGSAVSSGDTLLTLADVDYSADYQTLLRRRKILVNQSNALTKISKTGYVCAEEDGVISSLDESLLVDGSDADSTSDSSAVADSGSGSEDSTADDSTTTSTSTSTTSTTTASTSTASTSTNASTTMASYAMPNSGVCANAGATTNVAVMRTAATRGVGTSSSGNTSSSGGTSRAGGTSATLHLASDSSSSSGVSAQAETTAQSDTTAQADTTAQDDSDSSSSSSSSTASQTIEQVTKTVNVVWTASDGTALSEDLPESVAVTLSADGAVVNTATLSDGTDWAASFEVDKTDADGNAISYEFALESEVDGFSSSTSTSGNKTNIILKKDAESTSDDDSSSSSSSSSSGSTSKSSSSTSSSSSSSSKGKRSSSSSGKSGGSSGKGGAAAQKSGSSAASGSSASASATGGSSTSSEEVTTEGSTIEDATDEENAYSYGETVVCTMTPNDTVSVDVSVDELDIGSIVIGSKVQVTLDALTGQSFEGEVSSLDPFGTNSGGNTKYTVTISMDKQEDMLLGMNASVGIGLEEHDNVLLVPEAALVEQGGKTYVYTSYDEAKDELGGLQEVQTGVADGTNVEITDGLEEGQTCYYRYAGTITYTFANS